MIPSFSIVKLHRVTNTATGKVYNLVHTDLEKLANREELEVGPSMFSLKITHKGQTVFLPLIEVFGTTYTVH